jgi:hypothetical protein
MSFSDYDAVVKGEAKLVCPSCQENMTLNFQPGRVAFVLKDSAVGGWVSKAGKENKYRAKRREVMAQRERDHVFKSSLQPNYKGEETGTWREAQEAARKEGGDTAASTYTPLVAKETAT